MIKCCIIYVFEKRNYKILVILYTNNDPFVYILDVFMILYEHSVFIGM